MKFKILVFALIAICSLNCYAKKDKDKVYEYEIMCYDGNQNVDKNYKTVKIYSYAKKVEDARELCQMNAIHAILFKGYQGSGADTGMRALCPDGYNANMEYFDSFFNNGDYRQYVSLTNNGLIEPDDMIKVDKKKYKVGMLITINITELRRHLEKDGVIKSLNNIF